MRKARYFRRIVKLQRPLATNHKPEVLIYDEVKRFVFFLPYDEHMVELFGDDIKQYWLADIPRYKGDIKLIKRMEEQEW